MTHSEKRSANHAQCPFVAVLTKMGCFDKFSSSHKYEYSSEILSVILAAATFLQRFLYFLTEIPACLS